MEAQNSSSPPEFQDKKRPDDDSHDDHHRAICPCWTRCTTVLHQCILYVVVHLACLAARRPYTVIMVVLMISFVMISVGLITNFRVVLDPEEFLIPFNTPIEPQFDWILETFPDASQIYCTVLLHEQGNNVLSVHTARKAMELMDILRTVPEYLDICSQGDHVDIYGNASCWSYGVTRYWDHNMQTFDAMVETDEDVMIQVSQPTFPGNTPVAHDVLLGNYERGTLDTGNVTLINRIVHADSYVMSFSLPGGVPGVEDLEYIIIDKILQVREEWRQLPKPIYIELLTPKSIEIEVERAIWQDLPLLPVVFLIMTQFCSIFFFKCDKIKSRWLLGYGAVITIGCSMMTGFGILFIAGVPVTSMLVVLPFIIFGIGLDDTFIITGAFFRTSENQACWSVEERVKESLSDIGLSVTLTTLTTMAAFLLTSISTIRAIRWLGWYAFLTIFVDFIYQITFFIALLVLDERRILANRRDVCFWVVVPPEETTKDGEKCLVSYRKEARTIENLDHPEVSAIKVLEDEVAKVAIENKGYCKEMGKGDKDAHHHTVTEEDTEENENADKQNNYQLIDRIMVWYSKTLIPRKWFQISVCTIFLGYFVLCCYSTTQLEQDFKPEDFMMDDSFVTSFVNSLSLYVTVDYGVTAYFRHVNQSDSGIQNQMKSYIDDLLEIDHIGGVNPPFCWVQNFPFFEQLYANEIANKTYNEQVAYILSIPSIREVYGSDIVLDSDTGEIIASRCLIFVSHIDFNDVENQLDFYEMQSEVSHRQPINNESGSDSAFFTFEYLYFVWEFYDAINRELIFSTIAGCVAVAVIGFILIPHWSAIFFLLSLIVILYVDVLGTIRLMGLNINSMTFVCIIVSVGLLVDFLMHVLLRYYESPGVTKLDKVQSTLQTMGASIFVGGMSTFLGILPLSIGVSMVMRTVFLCFLAMVTLGVAHGLIFLPVLLTLFGPLNHVRDLSLSTGIQGE